MELWIEFDGLCEPVNPGGIPCFGFLIGTAAGDVLTEVYGVVPEDAGPRTNNTAEWYALATALRQARGLGVTRLSLRGDSQLVINQLTGRWNVNKEHLAKFRAECQEFLKGVEWDALWVPREQNDLADALSQKAYREATGKNVIPRKRYRRPTA